MANTRQQEFLALETINRHQEPVNAAALRRSIQSVQRKFKQYEQTQYDNFRAIQRDAAAFRKGVR
jgi:hypothetical protein